MSTNSLISRVPEGTGMKNRGRPRKRDNKSRMVKVSQDKSCLSTDLKEIKLTRTLRANNDELLVHCRSHLKAMTLVDSPEVKLLESKGPTSMNWDSRSMPRVLEYLATPQSMPLKGMIRSLFGDRIYPFRLSTALNMSSSAAGIVNSTINVDAVRSSADFSAISSIFQEFFVVRVDAHWQPVSLYNYPLTGTSAASVSSLPIGCAPLEHAAIPYTSLSSLANNFKAGYHNTGAAFAFSWVNVEKSNSGIEPTTASTQSWCDTAGGQTYTGAIQFLSQPAPPPLPVSQILGTFMTHWEVLFRVRQ